MQHFYSTLIMKLSYISLPALLAVVSASCISDKNFIRCTEKKDSGVCEGSGDGKRFVSSCDLYNGNRVSSDCSIQGSKARCVQMVGPIPDDSTCTSSAWGKGDGSVKNGGCCMSNDDCRDSCNGVVCGVSWGRG